MSRFYRLALVAPTLALLLALILNATSTIAAGGPCLPNEPGC